MKPTASAVRQMRRDNLAYPAQLARVPVEKWPQEMSDGTPRIELFRSRTHLVQVFAEPSGIVRLSVNRTDWDERQNRFREDITWDDLQRLKGEAGYANHYAVEVFPPDIDVVNVANMRHLWVFPANVVLPFAWRSRSIPGAPSITTRAI